MPKHKSHALMRSPTIVVTAPARKRSPARRAAHAVARGTRHVARKASAHLPTLSIGGGALALGFLDGKGMLDKLPAIGGSHMTTLAIGGFALTRLSRNPIARAVGIAALAAGLYDFGRAQGGTK